MAAWGAIITAAIAAASALINQRQQRKANRETIKANKELAEYSYSKDLEMWNRQNEYNAPTSQMQRYTAAGLNPNMIYDSGGSAGNSSSMPNYEPPNVEYRNPALDLTGTLSQYQDFQLKQAQIDNLKAAEENTRARTLTEAFRANATDLAGQSAAFELGARRESFPTELDTKKFDLDAKRQSLPYDLKSKSLGIDHAEFDLGKKQAMYAGDLMQQGYGLQQSQAALEVQLKQLQLMSQQQQLNILEQDYKKKQMSSMDIENEKRMAETLFKKYETDWIKQGVTTSDNPLLRLFVRMMNGDGMLGELGGSIKTFFGNNSKGHDGTTSNPNVPRREELFWRHY